MTNVASPASAAISNAKGSPGTVPLPPAPSDAALHLICHLYGGVLGEILQLQCEAANRRGGEGVRVEGRFCVVA